MSVPGGGLVGCGSLVKVNQNSPGSDRRVGYQKGFLQ